LRTKLTRNSAFDLLVRHPPTSQASGDDDFFLKEIVEKGIVLLTPLKREKGVKKAENDYNSRGVFRGAPSATLMEPAFIAHNARENT